MSNEPENTADTLIAIIEHWQGQPKLAPGKSVLEKMRSLAIDSSLKIKDLEKRAAYHERDSREVYRTFSVLRESGVLTQEQYDNAYTLVTDARSPSNTFTDVDAILKRSRGEARNAKV